MGWRSSGGSKTRLLFAVRYCGGEDQQSTGRGTAYRAGTRSAPETCGERRLMPDRRERPANESAAPAASEISPDVVRSFRSQLTSGDDIVDPTTWAGSIPQVQGIPPRVRIGRSRWFNLLWLLPIGFVGLIVAVATAKGLRNMPSVERFVVRYPGTIETGREGESWFPDLGRHPALLQPVPVDLHHQVRSADPQ